MENDQIKEVAERLLITWIGSPNFKARALQKTMLSSTEMGQQISELNNDTSVAAFDKQIELRNLMLSSLERAIHLGWLERTTTHIGRRPQSDPVPDEWAWATREVDDIQSTNRRARFVVDGLRTQWVILTITDKFMDHLTTQENQLKLLDGLTRDEAATQLKTNRFVVNQLVRKLLTMGWRESKIRTPDGRKTILVKPT